MTSGLSDQPMVQCRGLVKRFADTSVLDELDLAVGDGERVALIGPSGSGKTTLLRIVMALEKPTAGTVTIDGEPLWGHVPDPSEKHLRQVRSKVGYVFQQFNLFPHMTALQNVMEAPVHVRGVPKAEARERGLELLETVGLRGKHESYPAQLSGGQQQRVAIARALALGPEVMLFDEVTSALDPELAAEVLRVIIDLADQTNMTMLLVTHEMNFARRIAHRVAFFDHGKIIEQGPPDELFSNPKETRTRTFLKTVLEEY